MLGLCRAPEESWRSSLGVGVLYPGPEAHAGSLESPALVLEAQLAPWVLEAQISVYVLPS